MFFHRAILRRPRQSARFADSFRPNAPVADPDVPDSVSGGFQIKPIPIRNENPLSLMITESTMQTKQIIKAILSATVLATTPVAGAADREVNVYSYRQPQLIEPMFAAFTADTGIKVNAVYAKTGMLERLQNEGRNSPADLVFTVDIGRLSDIQNAGLTQPAALSAAANGGIPANLRDPGNHWFGLTGRARIIITSRERVAGGEIDSYEDLADPQWKGRICTRSGKHPYNIALIASMMQRHGDAAAQAWLAGVKSNLARKPQGNDRAQAKAIAEGVCDVGVINHYYLYQMAINDEQKAWHDAVNVVFPNQAGRGTHMNISGMAMTRYAPNRDEALALMEFLAGDKAQKMYAEVNGEYPVNEDIAISDYLKSLGDFKRDTLDLSRVAARRAAASKMVDRVGYND